MMQIDALKAYKEQLAAGFTEEQATASVAALYAAIQNVATKQELFNNIQSLRTEMNIRFDNVDNKFELLRKEIKVDIENAINGLKTNTELFINGLKGYATRWFVFALGLNLILPFALKKYGV